ncbi:MAG: carbohydrate kinase [Clostridiaceae bacterium]|nr:carbohydrate kinase [Clostridiaceae bacterium]
MEKSSYVICYDLGTTGVKTCLFQIADKIELLESDYAGYSLHILDNGGAEQDTEEWWQAMCQTTRRVIEKAEVDGSLVEAVSFCAQMQCLVLVDREGQALGRAMSYMDNRASSLYGKGPGLIQLLTWLRLTKAAPVSAKDPLWRYKWVERHEPDRFARVNKWLDAKDYLACRMTGRAVMTEGSAYPTFLYDIRRGKRGWSKTLCRLAGVKPDHLPPLIAACEPVGPMREDAARQLGLEPGTTVYSGGGDAELIGVGVGAVEPGDPHLYLGTSGWVSTVTEKQLVDVRRSIASILGVQAGRYHYFAEMETAGKSLEWVKDHLALDEIDIYLEKKQVTESLECVYRSLYDYLCEVISRVPAGSGGVLFTPWLHGNRCPFEDARARAIFFNIGLDTGKSELIRSVIEGIAFHCRFMMEAHQRKLPVSDTIWVCGGIANAPVICQILADILEHEIGAFPDPQNVGALGSALLMALAMGRISSMAKAKDLLPPPRIFQPDPDKRQAYEKNYQAFTRLYKQNKKLFALLND